MKKLVTLSESPEEIASFLVKDGRVMMSSTRMSNNRCLFLISVSRQAKPEAAKKEENQATGTKPQHLAKMR